MTRLVHATSQSTEASSSHLSNWVMPTFNHCPVSHPNHSCLCCDYTPVPVTCQSIYATSSSHQSNSVKPLPPAQLMKPLHLLNSAKPLLPVKLNQAPPICQPQTCPSHLLNSVKPLPSAKLSQAHPTCQTQSSPSLPTAAKSLPSAKLKSSLSHQSNSIPSHLSNSAKPLPSVKLGQAPPSC